MARRDAHGILKRAALAITAAAVIESAAIHGAMPVSGAEGAASPRFSRGPVGGPIGDRAGSMAVARPFRLDLSTPADFVAQTNFVQCVGASMQMMLNIIRSPVDSTAATQRSLQALARRLSPARPDGVIRQGASVVGWAAGLTTMGAGPYRVSGLASLQDALQVAARAIRETGRPVGLLVWRGRHAWVMSGFEATADRLSSSGFTVTRAIVLDPLYPYGSSTWGPSPVPRQAMSVSALGAQFVPRGRWPLPAAQGTGAGAPTAAGGAGQPSGLTGRYVLVLPFDLAPFRHGIA